MIVRTRLYAEVRKEHVTEWLLNLKSFEEAHEECQLHIEVNDEDITPEEVKTLASLFEAEVEVIPR